MFRLFISFSILILSTTGILLHAEPHPLHTVPEWRTLERYQETLTAETFKERLKIFSPHGEIYQHLQFLGDESAVLYESPDQEQPVFRFRFLPPGSPEHQTQPYTATQLTHTRQATPEQPLLGLRIAIDPGHIGSKWSNIEERHMKYGRYPVVKEGDLTLTTAQHLRRDLEAAGATVFFTREDDTPVTRFRPEDFRYDAMEWAAASGKYFTFKRYRYLTSWYRNLLFYRVAEIKARGRLLESISPEYTICIHYNAAPWPGRRPRLYRAQKLVAFVHGSYLPDELQIPRQLYALFNKLFENVSSTEITIADAVTREMQAVMKMRAENYDSWKSTDRVSDNPYIWSRNVIANRVFPGPVIFVEGPYMNDRESFYRIQAGDYEGLKKVRGKEVPSVFREFAGAISGGLIKHFQKMLAIDSEAVSHQTP